MRKATFVLVLLMLVALCVPANADVRKNPHSFEVDMHCGGDILHAIVPITMADAGKLSDGRIAHVRTYYIDFDSDGFEDDELLWVAGRGRGIETTWCTWTWDFDSFVHGMDIQFTPPD